ncbi:lysylphosphatidylglycerol synthase transmembrane domain-containing protein [Patescibacteria group bacterium]
MIKKTFVFLGFLAIGIALFVSILLETGFDAIADSLIKFSLVNFLFLLLVSLVNFGLFTWRWSMIIKLHLKKTGQKSPSFVRLFLHRMSAYAVSYLTPTATSGGEPVRVFFLQEDKIDTKTAVSTIVIDKVFEYTALILFIFSGLLVAIIEGSIFSGKVEIMLGGGIILFGTLIFWFYYSTMKHIGFFSSVFRFFRLNKIKRLKGFEEGIVKIEKKMAYFYTKHIPSFIFMMFLSFVMVFFMVFEHFIIAYFMGVKLTFLQSFLSATIPGISYMLPIPGALGALETSHAGIFVLLGVSINVFVFVLIMRLRDLIFILIGLAHASGHGIGMIIKGMKNGKA